MVSLLSNMVNQSRWFSEEKMPNKILLYDYKTILITKGEILIIKNNKIKKDLTKPKQEIVMKETKQITKAIKKIERA